MKQDPELGNRFRLLIEQIEEYLTKSDRTNARSMFQTLTTDYVALKPKVDDASVKFVELKSKEIELKLNGKELSKEELERLFPQKKKFMDFFAKKKASGRPQFVNRFLKKKQPVDKKRSLRMRLKRAALGLLHL